MLRLGHWAVVTGLVLTAVVATWVAHYGWSETSWRAIEALAVTEAERVEAASDKDAVLEPIPLGVPFAAF